MTDLAKTRKPYRLPEDSVCFNCGYLETCDQKGQGSKTGDLKADVCGAWRRTPPTAFTINLDALREAGCQCCQPTFDENKAGFLRCYDCETETQVVPAGA